MQTHQLEAAILGGLAALLLLTNRTLSSYCWRVKKSPMGACALAGFWIGAAYHILAEEPTGVNK